MSKYFAAFLMFLWPLSAAAEDRELAELFLQHGVEGTIVISSLRDKTTYIHNDSRANYRFPTASTFKILNTLISLEEKVASGNNDVLKWDGHIYDFPAWNRDQTLESAFKVSCVWCYQQLARRIGPERYRHYLRKSAYGKLREPFEITTFWLDGALQISAVEQIAFLKRVYQRALPFESSSYETLRQIMLIERSPTYAVWAKSGWATSVTPQVGWYVGYVETSEDVWFFATNIKIDDKKKLPLRWKLTLTALKTKAIIK